ncbi:MAG: sugar transferase [Thermonemataceae bacterium]|nr:sugar transferase [Thermonemataceae bacterium]
MYVTFIKPIGDAILVFLLLPLCFLPFIFISVLLYISNDKKIFFIQQRPGYQGKPFGLIKFRTLNENEGTDEQRETYIGKWLRKTHLDELPQMINILRGEMSWIGPRPLLSEYMQIYTKEQHKRHNIKPGVTGLAQVKLPKVASIDEKTKYDIFYVEKVSFLLDLKIILFTLIKLLGLAQNTHRNS